MEERIRELFATMLQVDAAEVTDAASPDELPTWDSMQHLILVSGFEEELGVDVDPEEAVEMYENFAAFKKVIAQKLSAKR